jgi:predicted RNA-binding protein with RPS1 domain
MDYIELTRRLVRDLHDSVPKEALVRFHRAMDRAGDLGQLVEQNDPVIDPFSARQLFQLVDIYKEWTAWKEEAKNLRRELAAGRTQLPDGGHDLAGSVHELRALARIARMCPRSGCEDHAGWTSAVEAHLDLWRACLRLSIDRGTVTVTLPDPSHPDAAEFENHVATREVLGRLPGYRWLGARRGERAGVLVLAVELPRAELAEQAEARLPSLGPAAVKRGADSVLAELALDELEPVVRSTMDRRARGEAVDAARRAYLSLLEVPPVDSLLLLAIHVGSARSGTGIAVLDRGGNPLAEALVPPGQDPGPALAALVAEHQPDTAALPISADDHERLGAVERALGELPAVRIHTAALAEARAKLTYEKEIAGAVVIGRRALRPTREWGRVDPLSLGLGEYPREIDPEELREALVLARRVASWERHRRRRTGKAAGTPAARAARRAVQNPLVKTIRDLKPGMTVNGVITNLTRFGAFVNIGLGTEAMIHVSQLAAEFVEEPSQVVRVGQQVSARVLEVVPEKSRIALSLKPLPEREQRFAALPPRADGAAPGARPAPEREWPPASRAPRERGGGSGGDKKSRSAALADLDALFKK